MHGVVRYYLKTNKQTNKKNPKTLKRLTASRSLLPVIIFLKLSILYAFSAYTCTLRKAPLKIIVFINLATDVGNLSPYHGRTRLLYSPDGGLAGGKEGQTSRYNVFSLSLLRVSAETEEKQERQAGAV